MQYLSKRTTQNSSKSSHLTSCKQGIFALFFPKNESIVLIHFFVNEKSKYLNSLCDFALQLFRHKVLKHKTPPKRLSFSFVLLRSHKVSVVNRGQVSGFIILFLIFKWTNIKFQVLLPEIGISNRVCVHFKRLQFNLPGGGLSISPISCTGSH